MNIKFCFIALTIFFVPLTSLAKKIEFKELGNKKELKLLNKRVEGKVIKRVFEISLQKIKPEKIVLFKETPFYRITEYYSYSYIKNGEKKFIYKKNKYLIDYCMLTKLTKKEKGLESLFLREQKYYLSKNEQGRRAKLGNIVSLLFRLDIYNKYKNKDKALSELIMGCFNSFEEGPFNSNTYQKILFKIKNKQNKNSFIYTLPLKLIKKLINNRKILFFNIRQGNIYNIPSHLVHLKLKYVFRNRTKWMIIRKRGKGYKVLE